MQGLESRDDAAAYLQQLGHAGGHGRVEAITSSVDDSSIERSSTFKQLASWGGFRRHFIEGETKDDVAMQQQLLHASQPAPASAARSMQPPMAGAAESSAEWRQQLRDQLLAKRAEVLATQKKLESLSLEQQELEMLYTRAS